MNAVQLDLTFNALADPTRRAILSRLARGEATVSELAAPFSMSQPAISKHLKVLERAGLIAVGQDAQRRPRRLVARPLAEANDWLGGDRRAWEEQFQRLDDVLAELMAQEALDAEAQEGAAQDGGSNTDNNHKQGPNR